MFCYPQSNKVLDFYEGATILIVGGTGFVGKALLEKVLRCLKVKKVYLLIRSKDGHCAKDRLGKLMEDRLFDQVRDHVNKVEAVQVDFDVECFGLDNVIAETVQREVEVVFYCLADVKFNRPLKEAFQTNVQIGKYLLRWCRGFPNLKSIVYTSTFYSECTKNFVEEKVSEDVPFGDYKLCMKMLTTLSSDECEKIKVDLLGNYPNTYTFTKKLAEIMIQKEFVKDLPIGVYRPSAVSPSYQEPQPGWTDNFYGIAAIIRASIDGINQVVLSDLNQAGNYVPLDYCVNAILVGGFDISQRKSSCCKSEPTVTVYNHVSKVNKCSYGDVIRYSAESKPRFWERLAWKYLFVSTINTWLYYYLLHICYWYAGCKDLMAKWMNRTEGTDDYYYRRSLHQYASYNQAVAFAMCRSWSSYNKNLTHLKRHLSETETVLFYFDLDDLDWPDYIRRCVDGVSKLISSHSK